MTLLGIMLSRAARPRPFPLRQRAGITSAVHERLPSSGPDQRSASRSAHGKVTPSTAQREGFIAPVHGSVALHGCRHTLAEGWSESPAGESGCPDAMPLRLDTRVDADHARRPVALGWQPPTDKQAGAIVVLAGAVHDPFPPLPLPLLGSSTYERCRYAAWLYHEWHPLPLVPSGGSLHSDQWWSYADVMRDFLLRHGVPEPKLIIEHRSRSPDENARYTAEILRWSP
jgi:hypothetical protein